MIQSGEHAIWDARMEVVAQPYRQVQRFTRIIKTVGLVYVEAMKRTGMTVKAITAALERYQESDAVPPESGLRCSTAEAEQATPVESSVKEP